MMKAYFTDRNIRRGFVLALFLGLLWVFRHLFMLLIFFVVFERTLALVADSLAAVTKLKFKWCVLLALALLFAAVAGFVWFGVATVAGYLPEIRQGIETITATIKGSELYGRYREIGGHVSTEQLVEQARHHASSVLFAAARFGKEVLYLFIGLVFSIVFLLERDKLEELRESMPMDSVPRILLRYFGHVLDAIAITLKLQVIVAVVSAVITLPVLLALRLPGIPALVAMNIVAGLIPVVGGPIAGAVLMTLAYVTRGPIGLAIFVVSTFVLHKIESYYLNPRLTAKHVKLPSFAIIVSLILFEHVFGLAGLFLSFPCLYVAAKIREGWVDPEDELREEEETTAAMRGLLPRLKGFKLRPAVLASVRSSVAAAAPRQEPASTPEADAPDAPAPASPPGKPPV